MERFGMMSHRMGRLLFFAGYLGMVAITLVAAPLPQIIFPWEASAFYEGGWRVLQGMTPHVDFYSPLGPLTYLITALGLCVTGGSLSSIGWGVVLTSIPLALAIWHFLSQRVPPWICLAASLYLAGIWLLPFPLRFGFRDLTYAGLYNRECYSLLGLLALLLLFPRLNDQDKPRGGMIAVGVLLGLLLGLKVNFVLIGGLFVGFYLLNQRDRLRRCAEMGCGFALVVVPLLVYLRFDLAAVARDFTTMTLARTPGAMSVSLHGVWRDLPVPALFNLAALMVEIYFKSDSSLRLGVDLKRLISGRGLEFMLFESAQILCLLSIAPEGDGGVDIPLLDLYGLIQAGRLAACLRRDEMPLKYRPLLLAAMFGTGYPILRSFLLFGLGFGFSLLTAQSRWSEAYCLPMMVRDGGHAEILRVGKLGYNPEFIAAFEDGKVLLARHVDVHQARIASFDAANPFTFAFHGKSAPGMPIFWQEGRTVSLRGYPPAAEIFRDCDCLLVPRWGCGVVPDTTTVLRHVYAEPLREDYALVESTQYWDLYVRKAGGVRQR